jgi:hypothetical protein
MSMGYTVIAVAGGAIVSVMAGLVLHLSVLQFLILVVLSANASVLGSALLKLLWKARSPTGTVQQKSIRLS